MFSLTKSVLNVADGAQCFPELVKPVLSQRCVITIQSYDALIVDGLSEFVKRLPRNWLP
jgi:hypothetical protein